MNCVYAPLGSISAKLCNFHKYLISKEFAGFLIQPVVISKLFRSCRYNRDHRRSFSVPMGLKPKSEMPDSTIGE